MIKYVSEKYEQEGVRSSFAKSTFATGLRLIVCFQGFQDVQSTHLLYILFIVFHGFLSITGWSDLQLYTVSILTL